MTTDNLSSDTRYSLRTRICMLLSIDPLSDDETLYNSIRLMTDDFLDASQTIRMRLCQALELDYCIDKDMDIYHAIAMLYVEIDTLRTEMLERTKVDTLKAIEANFAPTVL